MSEDVKTLYQKSGMDGRVGFGRRPAILVVDFVKGFTCPDVSPLASDKMSVQIQHTRKLLDSARAKDILAVFTTEGFEENMKDAAIWYKKMPGLKSLDMKQNPACIEVDDRLGYDPEKEVVVLKKTASPFFGTNLTSILIAHRVDTLIVTGATTSGCLRAAVGDACAFGFRAIIVEDCVADRTPGPHEANLFDMDSKYGDVVSLDAALSYLNSI